MSALVFDLDGTLIDSLPGLDAALNAALSERNLPGVSMAQTRTFVGNGIHVLAEKALAHVEAHDVAPAEFADRILEHYKDQPHDLALPYPGVKDEMARLVQQGHALAVCTNKPTEPALDLLDQTGLRRFFKTVVGGDTLAQRKPHPAPLQLAFTRLGTDRGLFVGDSEVDAATALAANVPFLLFARGYRQRPLLEIPHEVAFDDYAQFGKLIRSVHL